MGVEGETVLLTRYCFSLIRFVNLRSALVFLVCVVDVRVYLRSSVRNFDEALDLAAVLCTALSHTNPPARFVFRQKNSKPVSRTGA